MKTNSVLLCIFVGLFSAIEGYDEAGCDVRSNETYYSGINAVCQLPLGAHLEDDDGGHYAPFLMNRCSSSEHHDAVDTVLGIVFALIACAMFGSMFLPVKKFDTGDGMFFQWLMAIGALLVGIVFNVAVGTQPPFFSFAMTGGIVWGVGNILTVPTLKLLGIGMTQTMVGIANAIGGWISGRFILCQPLKSHILNTLGVVVLLISAILLSFVGSDGRKKKVVEQNGRLPDDSSLRESVSGINASSDNHNDETTPLVNEVNEDKSWVDKLGKLPSRAIGILMAVTSGFLFGFQFLPVEFLRNCDNDAFSCEELDYVFAQYIGIFVCSTIFFAIYCCVKKFNPQVYSKLIIPGIITGIMYGIGTAMWFLSNKYVGLPVAFPIITSGSGMVGSAWGILVFREIRGKFNILMFVFAFLVVIAGIILVALSH